MRFSKSSSFTLLLVVYSIPLALCQQWTIPVVSISTNERIRASCPMEEELNKSLQHVRGEIYNTLSNLFIVPECGGGLWHRVVHPNMSDPSQQCPCAWRMYNTSGVRACGRPDSDRGSCPATFYSTTHHYSRVCGRIIGYQVASPDGFYLLDRRHKSKLYGWH